MAKQGTGNKTNKEYMNNITAWQKLGVMYSGNRISSEQVKTARDIIYGDRNIHHIQMDEKDLYLDMSTSRDKPFVAEINYWGQTTFVDKMPFANP